MNSFERFLAQRPCIEKDDAIMELLGLYSSLGPRKARDDKRLCHIASGQHHSHFRLGKVGDLWLATREYVLSAFKEYDGTPDYASLQRNLAEHYIDKLILMHEYGRKDIPSILGGVQFGSPAVRYFLIVEDLTQGGWQKLEMGNDRKSSIVGSREVFHDTVESFNDPTEFRFMQEELMIKIEK